MNPSFGADRHRRRLARPSRIERDLAPQRGRGALRCSRTRHCFEPVDLLDWKRDRWRRSHGIERDRCVLGIAHANALCRRDAHHREEAHIARPPSPDCSRHRWIERELAAMVVDRGALRDRRARDTCKCVAPIDLARFHGAWLLGVERRLLPLTVDSGALRRFRTRDRIGADRGPAGAPLRHFRRPAETGTHSGPCMHEAEHDHKRQHTPHPNAQNHGAVQRGPVSHVPNDTG